MQEDDGLMNVNPSSENWLVKLEDRKDAEVFLYESFLTSQRARWEILVETVG